MSESTPIEWCDSTINPTMGCDGCELWDNTVRHCYAGVLHERYGGKSKGYAPEFRQVTLFPGRMAATLKWKDLTGTTRPGKPWLNGMPRLIFVSDMSDALSLAVPFDYLKREIIDVVRGSPHQYLWLTKRPKRMAEFAQWLEQGIYPQTWPDNLWAGTSVTNQQTANQRVPQLLQVPARVRFLSVEPMLDQVDLSEHCGCICGGVNIPKEGGSRTDIVCPLCDEGVKPGISWVILGGESGPKARPCNVEWIRDGVRQCDAVKVPVFVKQFGQYPVSHGATKPGGHWPQSNVLCPRHEVSVGGEILFRHNLKDKKGGDMDEWPEDLRRRHMPQITLPPPAQPGKVSGQRNLI